LTFGGDPVVDMDSGSLFHFPHHCGIGDFSTFIVAFLIQSPADFHDTRRNDRRRQGNESTNFGNDLADPRIRFSLEIPIHILDHLYLRQAKFKGSGALGISGGMRSHECYLILICNHKMAPLTSLMEVCIPRVLSS